MRPRAHGVVVAPGDRRADAAAASVGARDGEIIQFGPERGGGGGAAAVPQAMGAAAAAAPGRGQKRGREQKPPITKIQEMVDYLGKQRSAQLGQELMPKKEELEELLAGIYSVPPPAVGAGAPPEPPDPLLKYVKAQYIGDKIRVLWDWESGQDLVDRETGENLDEAKKAWHQKIRGQDRTSAAAIKTKFNFHDTDVGWWTGTILDFSYKFPLNEREQLLKHMMKGSFRAEDTSNPHVLLTHEKYIDNLSTCGESDFQAILQENESIISDYMSREGYVEIVRLFNEILVPGGMYNKLHITVLYDDVPKTGGGVIHGDRSCDSFTDIFILEV